MRKLLYISVFALFLYACGSNADNSELEKKIDFNFKNVLNPLFFSEANMFNISFPLWFNHEVLENYQVDSIYMDVIIFKWINDTVLFEEVDYSFAYAFNSNGGLTKSRFTDNYELTKLFESTFDYSNSIPDSMGYSPPRIEKSVNLLIGSNPTKLLRTLSDLQRFERLEMINEDNALVVYKNTTSLIHEHHLFIKNPTHQNILFVDRLETNPEDVFYYGTPQRYSKAFCLTNLVKEDVHSEILFYEGENYPKSKKMQKNGLITKTDFVYDEGGRWLGQKDSLLLNTGQFIKLTDATINYSEKGLPISIEVKKGSSKEDLRTSKLIKLNYAFRK